jgi:NAD(P)H dehydrogenase (quinone)
VELDSCRRPKTHRAPVTRTRLTSPECESTRCDATGRRIEKRLDAAREDSGSALLHLRCGYFMTNLLFDLDGLRAGRLATTRPLEEPMPWVDPLDIATAAAMRLLAQDWTGRHVQAVHGPAHLTWTEAAAVLSTATGLTIDALQITRDEERADLRQAGMSEVAVEGIIGMRSESVTVS